jgi:hypothetical protein
VRSPAHADAEVRAMRDGGLRGRFAYGTALGMPNDQPMDVARMKRDIGNGPMITLGICSRNIDGNTGGRRGAITGMNMRGMGDPCDALVQLARAGDVDTTVVWTRPLSERGVHRAGL